MALDELENLFYSVLMRLLGFDPAQHTKRPAVRRAWPKNGQPDWTPQDDVLFLQFAFVDGQDVSQPLHDFWLDDGVQDLIRHQEQTRVMQGRFIAYGPHCVTNLDNIRTAIYNGIQDLRSAGVFVIPGNEAPKYAPELFQAAWWQRADLQMMFNVAKIYDATVKTITSVNITLNANRAQESETVISEPGIFIKKE